MRTHLASVASRCLVALLIAVAAAAAACNDAQQVSFDANQLRGMRFDTVHNAHREIQPGDTIRLDARDTTFADPSYDTGVVVGRVISFGATVPALGLRPGDTAYWVVQRVAGSLKARFVSQSSGRVSDARPCERSDDPDPSSSSRRSYILTDSSDSTRLILRVCPLCPGGGCCDVTLPY